MNKPRTIIISEVGVNHNGNLKIAKFLIRETAKAKADYVKFQYFNPKNLVSAKAKKSLNQISNTNNKENLFEMLSKYALSKKQILVLKNYCKSKGVKFLCTPFDEITLNDLLSIGVNKLKISSGDITNLPLIDYASKKKKYLIVSTGRSTMKEVSDAVKIIKKNKCKFSLLHCVSSYPAEIEEMNLKAINTLKKKFKCPVGLSDHSIGMDMAVAAVSLGANIIEKHITFDQYAKGPDHKASLNVKDLSLFVKKIRNIEKALGSGIKKPSINERKNLKNARKSIISNKIIYKNSRLTIDNISIKRPEIGLKPTNIKKVLGKRAKVNIPANVGITFSMIK